MAVVERIEFPESEYLPEWPYGNVTTAWVIKNLDRRTAKYRLKDGRLQIRRRSQDGTEWLDDNYSGNFDVVAFWPRQGGSTDEEPGEWRYEFRFDDGELTDVIKWC